MENKQESVSKAEPEAQCGSNTRCVRAPQSLAEAEMNRKIRGLNLDLMGFIHIGPDGVMRSIDADRNVIDAVGLTSEQFKIWFERLPSDEARSMMKVEQYRDVDGKYVDGSNVPRDRMFDTSGLQLIPPMSEEKREELRKARTPDFVADYEEKVRVRREEAEREEREFMETLQ